MISHGDLSHNHVNNGGKKQRAAARHYTQNNIKRKGNCVDNKIQDEQISQSKALRTN